jgi:hypothetical protein
MPDFECLHAFQVIKSTLEPLPIDTCLILDSIGLQLNCTSIIKRLTFDWKNAFNTHWLDFTILANLSFHNFGGVNIANTTVANNLSILLPVQDSPVTTCHHQDVCFIHVNCTVDCAALISVPNYSTLILCVGFYTNYPRQLGLWSCKL